MQAPRSDAFVVFGVTGDLVHKEIFPALYGLFRDEDISVPVIGVARSDWSIEQLIARARDAVGERGHFDEKSLRPARRDASLRPRRLRRARDLRPDVRRAAGDGSPLFYMAIPPSVFPVVTNCAGHLRLQPELPGAG